jgi:hypothetical protein
MKYQINIGLNVPNHQVDIQTQLNKTLDLLTDAFRVHRVGLAQSSTEPTLLAEFSADPRRVYEALIQISDKLGQDCVAVYNPQRQQGALLGSKAAEWGAFNIANFLSL